MPPRLLTLVTVAAAMFTLWPSASVGAQDEADRPEESTPAEPDQTPRSDPAEKLPAEPAEPGENDADAAQRSLVLPDNSDLRRKLERVRGQIASQDYADAARELGRFLQDPEIHDFFLNRDDQRRGGHSFQADVRKMVRDLPPAGRAAYRAQFEPLARSRLNAAIARGDEASLRDVASRFPETPSGDESLFRLGNYLRDHGRARAAAACLAGLYDRPQAAAPFEPGLSRSLAACWAQAGQPGKAVAAAAHARDWRIAANRQTGAAVSTGAPVGEERWARFLASIAPSGSGPTTGDDWTTYRGDSSRNGSVPAQAPFLTPRWSHAAANDSGTQILVDRAWQWYRDGHGLALPMLSPLAARDLVFVRTSRGVAAHDYESGRIRWRVPSDDEGDNDGLDQILWSEQAGGAFAVDEECVYFLEGSRLGDQDAGNASVNTLVAHEHCRGREGNLRWQAGGAAGGIEPRLAGAFFLGAPLSWQGSLYALVEGNGALSLVVLDRSTGRLLWTQELALVEQSISVDLLRLTVGATPSISPDEIIVCPTAGGVIVALDMTTQSLLWAYRYVAETSQTESIGEIEMSPRVDQSNRWLDGALSISGGRVIAAPPESQQLHCLDLRSGRPIWTIDRDGGLYVACVTGDHVIVVGRDDVRARRLEDGEIAWTLNLPSTPGAHQQAPSRGTRPPDDAPKPASPLPASPAGRGVFAGDRYFLPVTSAALLEIDLAGGVLSAVHKSPRELPVGNLIWHRGRFVAQGPTALEVFDERQTLAKAVEARLHAEPHDAAALLARGELHLSEGLVLSAIESFRSAHQAAPGGHTKSRLIAALLDALRENPEGSERLTAELDSLIGP